MPLQQATTLARRRLFCKNFPTSTPKWWRHHNTIMVVSQVVIHNPKYEHNNISQLRLRSWPIHCERQVYKSLFVHEIVRCWDRVPCHCQAIFKFYVLHFIIDIPQKTQTRTLRWTLDLIRVEPGSKSWTPCKGVINAQPSQQWSQWL